MLKKVVFSDYDGTIYVNEHEIDKNIRHIKEFRKQGGIFVVVTGRSKTSFDEVIEKYQIPYDYVILNNGAVIYDSIGNQKYNQSISSIITKKIINYLNFKENIELFYYDNNDKVNFCNQELLKIRVKTSEEEVAKQIEKEINTEFGDVVVAHAAFPFMYYSNLNYSLVDIVSIKAGKENGIKKLLEIMDIPNENVITIGDGRNDIDMLKQYQGYSIETAEKEVKEVASKIFKNLGEALEYFIYH